MDVCVSFCAGYSHRETAAVCMSAGFQLMQDVVQRALHSEHDADLWRLMMIFVSAAGEIGYQKGHPLH